MDTGKGNKEVRVDLDREFFKMQMNRIGVLVKSSITEDVAMKEYYPKFKRYTTERFSKTIQLFIDTWKYNSFPKPGDFIEMQNMTAKKYPDYTHNDLEKGDRELTSEEKSTFWNSMAKKFPKTVNKEKLPSQVELYNEQAKKGMIYSYDLQKWVHESLADNIGGKFIRPKETVAKQEKEDKDPNPPKKIGEILQTHRV